MDKRISLALAAAVLAWGAAAAAAAPTPPKGDGPMQFVGSKSGRGYFIATDTVERQGDTVGVWTVMADTHTTDIEGHKVIGAWTHEIHQCKDQTVAEDGFVTFDQDLAPATHDDRPRPPQPVVAGSLAGERLDLVCAGKTPKSGGPKVQGLKGAHQFVVEHL
jgi:hypothetical protein